MMLLDYSRPTMILPKDVAEITTAMLRDAEDDGWDYEVVETKGGWAIRVNDVDGTLLGYL